MAGSGLRTPEDGTIPMQPDPKMTLVVRLDHYTAITRTWDGGDDRRCRLCDRCDAEDGVCTILVDAPVSDEAASSYSSRGLDRPGATRDAVPRLGLAGG